MSHALWALTPPPDETVTASADPGLARCAQEVVPAQGLAVTPDGPGAQGSPVSPDRPAAAAQGGRAVRGGGQGPGQRAPHHSLAGLWVGRAASLEPLAGESREGSRLRLQGGESPGGSLRPDLGGDAGCKSDAPAPGPEGPEPWAPLPPGPPPLRLRPPPRLCHARPLPRRTQTPGLAPAAIPRGPPRPHAEGCGREALGLAARRRTTKETTCPPAPEGRPGTDRLPHWLPRTRLPGLWASPKDSKQFLGLLFF